MKDINKANFTAFKRYVFSLLKKEIGNNEYKTPFRIISIAVIRSQRIYNLSGNLKWKNEEFLIALRNSSNRPATICISNGFLKDWLCDLGYAQVDTTNLKESWNNIILDTFYKRIEGLVNFE